MALEGTGALPGVTGTAVGAVRVWVVERAVEGRAVAVGVVWEDWVVGMAAAAWAAAKGEEARAVVQVAERAAVMVAVGREAEREAERVEVVRAVVRAVAKAEEARAVDSAAGREAAAREVVD